MCFYCCHLRIKFVEFSITIFGNICSNIHIRVRVDFVTTANTLGSNKWWRLQMETFSASLAFVRGIHRSPVDSSHKGKWRGTLMYSLICAWTNGWTNKRDAGDLRRDRTHYDVIVIKMIRPKCPFNWKKIIPLFSILTMCWLFVVLLTSYEVMAHVYHWFC